MTTPNSEQEADHRQVHEKLRDQRSCTRTIAIQFIFQLDCQKTWEYTEEQALAFRENLVNLNTDFPPEAQRKAWGPAMRLVEGICAKHEEIDAALSSAAVNWVLFRMSCIDRSILRLGAYEILFSDKVNAVIAINEAVEMAKKFGQADSPRFVNGVLDKVRRQKLESADVQNS